MAPCLSAFLLASCALAVSGADQTHKKSMLRRVGQEHDSSHQGALKTDGFVRTLEFNHKLRVCNAYPFAAALDIYKGAATRLTGDAPMPYKACRDFEAPLKAGDKLEFRIGEASAGTFSVSDLPNSDAVLLLVVHRHDSLSTAVSFESHVFANLENAQVAVIDTYKGAARASPRIMDASELVSKQGKDGKVSSPRSEELRYDSVVAVNPGVYEVILSSQDGVEKARNKLVALKHESYVVLRTGVEAQQGPSFPEELVVFPAPGAEQLRSGAAGRLSMAAPLLATLTALLALLSA